jgi:hypothetical protein
MTSMDMSAAGTGREHTQKPLPPHPALNVRLARALVVGVAIAAT